jgi:hypothetical protein
MRGVKWFLAEPSPVDSDGLTARLGNEDEAVTQGHLSSVMDQYKLYVEIADRVSASRAFTLGDMRLYSRESTVTRRVEDPLTPHRGLGRGPWHRSSQIIENPLTRLVRTTLPAEPEAQ